MESPAQPVTDLSDEVLIGQIRKGEKQVYAHLVRRYNQRLYRIGMSILADPDEAEDAMQAAYVKAYEKLAGFRGDAAFGTWLTRIMINESLARKKEKQRFTGLPEKQLENHSTMTSPDRIVLNKELKRVLETAIAQLPEKYRLVFVLREIEALPVKDTSRSLGISEANVKVRLNRAKTLLKDQLRPYLGDHVYPFHLSRCERMVQAVMQQLEHL